MTKEQIGQIDSLIALRHCFEAWIDTVENSSYIAVDGSDGKTLVFADCGIITFRYYPAVEASINIFNFIKETTLEHLKQERDKISAQLKELGLEE